MGNCVSSSNVDGIVTVDKTKRSISTLSTSTSATDDLDAGLFEPEEEPVEESENKRESQESVKSLPKSLDTRGKGKEKEKEQEKEKAKEKEKARLSKTSKKVKKRHSSVRVPTEEKSGSGRSSISLEKKTPKRLSVKQMSLSSCEEEEKLEDPEITSIKSPSKNYTKNSTRKKSLRLNPGGDGIEKEIKRNSSEWEEEYKNSAGIVRLRTQSFLDRNNVGLVGLENLGNTCFMNTAIQCLSNTTPLTDFLAGSKLWLKDINTDNPLGSGGKLATEFRNLVSNLWSTDTSEAVHPKAFKNILGKFAPIFSGNRQHDCQELLVTLLDGLHEDLNRVMKKPYVEIPDANGRKDEVVAAEQWKIHLQRNKSIVVDLFQGQLKSTLKCSECKFASVLFDPFMYLSLPFPSNYEDIENLKVENLLEEFLKPEVLQGDEQWHCPKCKKNVDATKKFDLWKVPPVLIIHLKRFKYDREGVNQEKINSLVRFPLTNFSIAQYTSGKQRDSPIYNLYAVAHHIGTSAGGHYIATAKNRGDRSWHKYNDAFCSSIDEDEVEDSSAYVLFYQKTKMEEEGYRRQSLRFPQNWPHQLKENELKTLCEDIEN